MVLHNVIANESGENSDSTSAQLVNNIKKISKVVIDIQNQIQRSNYKLQTKNNKFPNNKYTLKIYTTAFRKKINIARKEKRGSGKKQKSGGDTKTIYGTTFLHTWSKNKNYPPFNAIYDTTILLTWSGPKNSLRFKELYGTTVLPTWSGQQKIISPSMQENNISINATNISIMKQIY